MVCLCEPAQKVADDQTRGLRYSGGYKKPGLARRRGIQFNASKRLRVE